MEFWLKIVQIIVSIALMTAILLQNKGGGVGGVFGGGGGGGGVYLTKRGMEKKLFIFTIILAVIFVLLSFGALWLRA